MRIKMFALAAVALIIIATVGPAFAERNILTPTGVTLGTGRFRVEGIVQADDTDNRTYWAGIGLSRFEVEGQRVETAESDSADLFNFELSLMPQTTFTPAVGVGVIDAADQLNRSFYGAVTKTVPLTDSLPLPLRDIRLTIGIGSGSISGVFAGAEATLLGFKLQAEYDSEDINASIGFPILGVATAKAMWIKDDFYVGVEVKPKF